MMERTIRVTGKGKIAVKPDRIRLLITQTDVLDSYKTAILESAEKKEKLTTSLAKLGFEKTDLKTLSFDIDTVYENYQARDKSWKRRLTGYRYTHHMKLEFPEDNQMLGKVLQKIAACPGKPEFSIEYTIADQEAAKNELLAKAVEDSKTKAEVLSRAAGVKLGMIQTIDYSWGEIDFVSRPVNPMIRECCDMEMTEENGIRLDIEADDIDVTDTVTVMWEIE